MACEIMFSMTNCNIVIVEKELVLEIDRLKHRNGFVHKKGGKNDKHTEELLRGLEQERDYYKNEVNVLQLLLKPGSRSPSPSGRVSRSQNSTPAKRAASPSPTRGDKKVLVKLILMKY